MTINIEEHLPVVKEQGLNTDKNADFDGTLNVAGASTLTGAITATGGVVGDVTGDVTGGITSPIQIDTADAITVTAAQSGTTFFANRGSTTQTYTLPAVAVGLKYTFITINAASETLIDQVASEVITVTSFAAVGADADTGIIAPAGGTGIKNTAATNAVGDSLVLVSDGVGWYGVGITSGIWASQ